MTYVFFGRALTENVFSNYSFNRLKLWIGGSANTYLMKARFITFENIKTNITLFDCSFSPYVIVVAILLLLQKTEVGRTIMFNYEHILFDSKGKRHIAPLNVHYEWDGVK